MSRSCVQQINSLGEGLSIEFTQFIDLVSQIIKSVNLIESAVLNNDTETALKIGKTGQEIEKSYGKVFKFYVKELKKKENTKELVSGLLIASALDQMGDTMLEISEAIISYNFGQPLTTERYYTLVNSLKNNLSEKEISEVELHKIAETRSGSGISAIMNSSDEKNETVAILKDGHRKKLKEEKAGVESWHEIFPGLAPKIIKYKKNGEWASLLIEHLEGLTFEQLILQDSEELRHKSLKKLCKTLKKVWNETKSETVVAPEHIKQMKLRLKDVFALHPHFDSGTNKICGLKVLSFSELLEKSKELENKLNVPFSVYIHGDFNVDNIIYDPSESSIKFIDLHRSKYMDYTQDASVFIVSNYRLQVFDKPVRERIFRQILDFYKFVQSYAENNNDEHFEFRLTLGVIRSLVTSTRFIKDKDMSTKTFMKARYLMEQVSSLDPKENTNFRFPVEDLFNA